VVLRLWGWAWGKHRQNVTPYETEYTASEAKSREMRCAEHVARKGQRRRTYMLSVGRPAGKILEYLGVDERIILK